MFTLILKPFKDWPGIVLLLLASTACAYHSPTEPTLPPADLAAPAALVVNAAPGRAGGTATVTALVSNRAGAPLAAVTVTFGTDAGRITPETAITNAQGLATAGVIAPGGAARITAQVGSLTTAALVAIQPVSPGTQAAPDVPTPEPTPLPTPPVTTPVPLTVEIAVQPGVAGTATLLGLAVSAPVTSAVWDFGDTSPPVTNSGAPTSHVYAAGTYPVSVIVTDAGDRTASAVTSLTIAPSPSAPPAPGPASLILAVSCTPAAHLNPTPCNVTASYGGTPLPATAITNVIWNWGDGMTDTTAVPVMTHSYAIAGSYTLFVTVTATTVDGPKTTTTNKPIAIL